MRFVGRLRFIDKNDLDSCDCLPGLATSHGRVLRHFWDPEGYHLGIFFPLCDSRCESAVVTAARWFEEAVATYVAGNGGGSAKALAYWWLGRAVHLLGDMASTPHVHLNPHIGHWPIVQADLENDHYVTAWDPPSAEEPFYKTITHHDTGAMVPDLNDWGKYPEYLGAVDDFVADHDLVRIFYSLANKTGTYDSDDSDGNGEREKGTRNSFRYRIDLECERASAIGKVEWYRQTTNGASSGPPQELGPGIDYEFDVAGGADNTFGRHPKPALFLYPSFAAKFDADGWGLLEGPYDVLKIDVVDSCDSIPNPAIAAKYDADEEYSIVPASVIRRREKTGGPLHAAVGHIAALYRQFWDRVNPRALILNADYTERRPQRSKWNFYYVEVPTGASALRIRGVKIATGGADLALTGNFKVYVRPGTSYPRTNDLTCTAFAADGCAIQNPTVGKWTIGVIDETTPSPRLKPYTIRVTIDAPVAANLQAPVLSTPANGSGQVSRQPQFAWSTVPGATSYRIVVATNVGALPTAATDAGGAGISINEEVFGGTSFQPPIALSGGITYYWKVKGRSAAAFGEWSQAYSFTTQSTATCSYGIYPVVGTHIAAGGQGQISVAASTGCTWAASSNAAWLTPTNGGAGVGGGTVTYSVAANPTTTKRQGTITIAGLAYMVSQAGQQCSYSTSPTVRTHTGIKQSATVSVSTTAGCPWTATSDASWITVYPLSGAGSGQVTYTIAENLGAQRDGSITIADRAFLVSQSQKPREYGSIRISIVPREAAFPDEDEGSLAPGAQWRIKGESDWINSYGAREDLPLGTYAIEYKAIPSWQKPTDAQVTISSDNPNLWIDSEPYTPAPPVEPPGTPVDVDWSEIPADIREGKWPPRVAQHAMAYDKGRERLVLFGGLNTQTGAPVSLLDTTWEWDGVAWALRDLAAAPSPRAYAAMAYDEGSGHVLLFGGEGVSGERLGDTWMYDGVTWKEVFPAYAPSPRRQAAMTYYPDIARVVLYGGSTADGLQIDSWLWDGADWARGPDAGCPARQHGLVYHPVLQELISYHSFGACTYRTSHYTGVSWLNYDGINNPLDCTDNSALAYSPLRHAPILFGGSNCPDETWEFRDAHWNLVKTNHTPKSRFEAAMVAAPELGGVFLFSGFDGRDVRNDFWVLSRPAEIGVTETSLEVNTTAGVNPQNRSVGVWNRSDGVLAYGVEDDADWVTVSPDQGTSVGEIDTITLSFDAAGLAPGRHQAELAVTNGEQPAVVVAVVLNVATFPCGNNVVEDGEDCDDGNRAAGDCCDANCGFESLGQTCEQDDNACTDDVCDGAGMCRHLPNSDACDDGDACTASDACQDGECMGTEPIVCVATSPCQTPGVCDPVTGICSATNVPDATSCDDGDVCTKNDVCLEGLCQPGVPVDCSDGNECTTDSCHPNSGCRHEENANECDDGVYCNGFDSCGGGACSRHTGSPCAETEGCNEVDDQCIDCRTSTDCEDGNVCTDDLCDSNTGCVFVANATECDDELYCNGTERCADGVCSVHRGAPCGVNTPCDENARRCVECADADDCDDLNECTDDACGPANQCAHTPNALACDDGVYCNGSDVCQDGLCAAHEGSPCRGDSVCAEAARACVCVGDVACDDGDLCDGQEACGEGGECEAGVALVCDDGDPCNGVETCEFALGCRSDAPLVCDDGDSCNGQEMCESGLGCQAGTPLNCDDGDSCNGAETCDSETGCQPGTALACDDGVYCNGTEVCGTDGCGPGTPPCPNRECDEETKACKCVSDDDCRDGNVCNGDESCGPQSECLPGTPPVCVDDGNACNGIESCRIVEGCVSEPLECDDHNVCNGEETCDLAVGCVEGEDLACEDDGNVCNGIVVCDPRLGCVDVPVGQCDDGDVCDGIETCDPVLGCIDGTPLECDDREPCNGEESCDPIDGCLPGVPVTTCSDDIFCNGAEVCVNDACVSGDPPCDRSVCIESAGRCCEDLDACCGQPVTSGQRPVATDCLYILNAAIGLKECVPLCICDVNASAGAPNATDALGCLNAAVVDPSILGCDCANSSLRLTSTSTMMSRGPTTTLNP